MRTPGTPLTFLLLALILLAGWALRNTDLDADPPETLSWSQGPFTDGALVVHNARNHALFGSWIRDHANDVWFYPLANGATRLVFALRGVGRGQAALANTFFGVLAVLLVALAIRRAFGATAALLFALFAAFHYYLVMYDRLAIAEPAMIFLLALAVVAFGFAERNRAAMFAAGFFAAAAVLIGKAHALYFPVALVLALVLATPAEGSAGGARGRAERNRRLVLALAGIGAAAAIWAAFLGVPHGDYLFSQASRATIEKHDDDPRQVVAQVWINLFHMGVQSNSVQRMPVLFLLAMAGLLGTVSKSWTALRREPPLALLFLFWLALGWILVATQHTPSPRYMLALLPPMLYFATRPVIALLATDAPKWTFPRDRNARAATLALLYFVLYQAVAVTDLVPRAAPGLDPLYETLIVQGIALALLAGAFPWLTARRKRSLVPAWPPRARRALVAVLLAGVLVNHGGRWLDWKRSHTYYLRDASIDIGESLGEGASLIGPYAPTFGLDNTLPAYPFLGRYERPGLLHELGPTHMVLVTRVEQAEIERRFPEIAANWTFAGLYPIAMQYADKIVVYRLPGSLDGRRLHDYEPSALERAVDAIANEKWDDAFPLLERFMSAKPDNAEGNYLTGVCRFKRGDLDGAIPLVERAAELRPERPLYHFRLGDYYARAGMRERAIASLETACALNDEDPVFRQALDGLRGRERGTTGTGD